MTNKPSPIAFTSTQDTACMWIAMLASIIPDLLPIIYEQAPDSIPPKTKKFFAPTTKQLREARDNPNKFAQLAIALVIKLQNAKNIASKQEDDIDAAKSSIRGTFPDHNDISKEVFAQIKKPMQELVQLEKAQQAAQDELGATQQGINTLLAQFRHDWRQHDNATAEQLIQELAQALGGLTDLEKDAIKKQLHSPSEIKKNLKKLDIDIAKIGDFKGKFKLITIETIVAVLTRNLQQNKITASNLKNITDKIAVLGTEQKQATSIAKHQLKQYQQLVERIDKISATAANNQPHEIQQKIQHVTASYEAEQRKAKTAEAIKGPEI